MTDIIRYIIALMIGSMVGFISGFQGIAGAFYISMLLLFTGLAKNQRQAAGTTLFAVLFPLSLGAVYEYWKTGDVEVYIALTILFFYMIFSWVGSKVNLLVEEKHVYLSLAATMLFTAIYFFHKFLNTKLK